MARKKIDFSEAKSNLDSPHIYTDKALKTFRKDELYEYSILMRDTFHHHWKKKNARIDELREEVNKLDGIRNDLLKRNVELNKAYKSLLVQTEKFEKELNSKVKCEDMPREINSLVNYFEYKVRKIKWYHLLFNPMIIIKEYNYLQELLIKLIVFKETVNEEVGPGECS